jgi:hypothetical protein
MKATVESSGNSNLNGLRGQDGKVHKNKHHHKEEENEEIKAYLTKLQELVPFMPKNRKLSKLEVITYVIDYIRDLRQTLGLPPSASRFPLDMDPMDMMSSAISLNVINSSDSTNTSSSPISSSTSSSHHRQPLCVISPSNNSSCGSQEIPQLMDKSSTDVDTRPVSC